MPTELELKSFHIDNFDMTYVEEGEGKPVVLLHGAITDNRCWDLIRPKIAQGYRVICPDLRYFGSGEWQDDGEHYGMQTHADDVVAFIRSIAEGPVTLVGWSYGGAISILVAKQHPDLVDGLFLYEHSLATFITDPDDVKSVSEDRAKSFQAAMPHVQAGDLGAAARLGFDGVNNEDGFFDRLPSEFRTMILENARTMPLMGVAAPPPPLSADDLRALVTPTRVLVGENTRTFYKIVGQQAADLMPAANLYIFEGGVHASPGLQPEQFADDLLSFLQELKH